MDLKNYEFLRQMVFQGKFTATAGDTLMQTGPDQYVYSGARGTLEVVLRDTTIASYLKIGVIKEVVGLNDPEPEPKKAEAPKPEPKPEPKKETPKVEPKKAEAPKPEPKKVEPPKPAPKPASKKVEPPKPEPKKAEAPKPAPKPKVAVKEVAPAPPEKVYPVLEAALGEEAGIDAVLTRTKRVVRKAR